MLAIHIKIISTPFPRHHSSMLSSLTSPLVIFKSDTAFGWCDLFIPPATDPSWMDCIVSRRWKGKAEQECWPTVLVDMSLVAKQCQIKNVNSQNEKIITESPYILKRCDNVEDAAANGVENVSHQSVQSLVSSSSSVKWVSSFHPLNTFCPIYSTSFKWCVLTYHHVVCSLVRYAIVGWYELYLCCN